MINGMFINNSLSHFSTNENSLNKKEPGKRPRSHSAPMILANDEKLIGIGSPGGKRIPMILSQVLLRHIVYGEELQEAIDAPRFIIEGNKIYVEETMSDDSIGELSQRGYDVYLKENPFFYGGVQALVIDEENNQIYGGADRRRIGTWDASKIDE
jgi:gamma-glutamyltranspeptidase/glutathione hydrolase